MKSPRFSELQRMRANVYGQDIMKLWNLTVVVAMLTQGSPANRRRRRRPSIKLEQMGDVPLNHLSNIRNLE